MKLERVEIAIAMKERMIVPDAERRDHCVDRLAHRHAACPQEAIVSCRGDRYFPPDHRPEFKPVKQPACPVEFGLGAKTLQDFRQNEVSDQQPFGSEQPVKQIGFGSAVAVEVIDPNRGVRHDHGGQSPVAPHSLEVAFPLKLASIAPDRFLALERDQHLESALDRFALGLRSRRAHRTFHQGVIDYDIGPHRPHVVCMLRQFDTHHNCVGIPSLSIGKEGPKEPGRRLDGFPLLMYDCAYGAVGFEWDERKAQANLRKHRVDFADAVTMFEDVRAVTVVDDDPEEERYVTIGTDALGRVLVVAYTIRGDCIRIISARRATARERAEYEKQGL